jgi:hypothetical protein
MEHAVRIDEGMVHTFFCGEKKKKKKVFAVKFINENMYSLGTLKVPNLLKRCLHYTPAMIPTVFICNINSFLPLDELPQKIIPYLVVGENGQNIAI